VTEQLEHLPALAPWVALALVGLAVLVALAWRRGGPLAALSTVLGGLTLWQGVRLLTPRRRPRAPSTPASVDHALLEESARRRVAAEELTAEATEDRAALEEVEDVPAGVRLWMREHLEAHRVDDGDDEPGAAS